MKRGTYRELTRDELAPFEGRSWLGFGPVELPGERYALKGVEWRVPGHPEPLIVVFQRSRGGTDLIAFSHIPYPRRLPPELRDRLSTMLLHADSASFIAELHEIANPTTTPDHDDQNAT